MVIQLRREGVTVPTMLSYMLIYDSFIVPNYSRFHDLLMPEYYEIDTQKLCNILRHTVNFQM
jgi:hypothetical protein